MRRPATLTLLATLAFALAVTPAIPAQGNTTAGEDGHEHRGLDAGEAVNAQLVAAVAGAAALVTFGGGMLVLAGRRVSQVRIHLLLGITGGLLLSIAFVDLLPAALETGSGTRWTMALSLLGLLALHLVVGERAGHGHAHGQGNRSEQEDPPKAGTGPADGHHARSPVHSGQLAWVAFLALAFHRLVDGLVLPAAFAADAGAGLAASGGILLHQLPDGIAGAALFVAAGWSKRNVAKGLAGLALFTPVGAAVGLTLTGISGLIGHMIGLAAATFVFVALAELLPELESPRFRWVVAGGFVIGYALLFLLELATGHL